MTAAASPDSRIPAGRRPITGECVLIVSGWLFLSTLIMWPFTTRAFYQELRRLVRPGAMGGLR